MTRRITILIGLALTIVLPLFHPSVYFERLPGLSPLFGREAFWWGLFVGVLLYVRLVERRPLASVGLHRPNWKTFVFGFAGAVVVLAASWATVAFLLPLLHLHVDAAAGKKIMDTPYLYRVVLVIRAGIVEELLFRGYGIERLQELTGSRFVAGVITLAAFSVAHLSYWGSAQLIIAAAAGLVLTILYIWRRDLISNMIAHIITDAVGIFLA